MTPRQLKAKYFELNHALKPFSPKEELYLYELVEQYPKLQDIMMPLEEELLHSDAKIKYSILKVLANGLPTQRMDWIMINSKNICVQFLGFHQSSIVCCFSTLFFLLFD
ncbi:hypothetical protein DFA_12307 [Cavenderia fasciculata]|uniref:Uncharacterized protein n=1 Tax=Cavenderia fasciculata TaxID=261658 RepID=F4QD60_CACFS|nr:uncharacterized protein DFA_12307 [Cavenderia fasciculata]EGG14531.1 hypothetical protein DFA_12307 [Cavenderia fasciculata]|eukprot:XP_004353965.1 hypothetical protein DFA_12307 [Cavenderia fasciculata]